MLTIAEEILLLALDDEKGTFMYGPDVHLDLALGGAVLMDLVLANRLDTDPDRLFVTNSEHLGDDVLDEILARVQACEADRTASYWLNEVRESAEMIRERLIARLVSRGILKRVEGKILWMFETRRYPVIDDRAELEVKRRITNILFSDDIPSPRDVVIISLVMACDLLEVMLDAREVRRVLPRAEQIARMDLIGRELTSTINEIRESIQIMVMSA